MQAFRAVSALGGVGICDSLLSNLTREAAGSVVWCYDEPVHNTASATSERASAFPRGFAGDLTVIKL